MTAPPLPTRRDEDWRYADIAVLAPLWPIAEETRHVTAQDDAQTLIVTPEMPVRTLHLTLAPGARCDLRLLVADVAYGRIEVRAELGEGAHLELGGAIIGASKVRGGSQTLEIVTRVTHTAPNATSNQVIRAVLGSGATGTYLGKVAVARGADGTDAAQSVRGMLLDRTATMNAKPELEIYADDVKCAHGCAIGELDAGALFYMASRGIPPEAAKALMLQAFLAEAFVGAADEEALTAAALSRLEALARLEALL